MHDSPEARVQELSRMFHGVGILEEEVFYLAVATIDEMVSSACGH